MPFTHAADEMGRNAVDDAVGLLPRRFHARAIPWATFTDPEVGRVGMTEAQAFDRYDMAARVATLPVRRIERARLADSTEGFVNLVTGPGVRSATVGGGRLLSVTVMCPQAGTRSRGCAGDAHRCLRRASGAEGPCLPSWALGVRQAAALQFHSRVRRRARPARPTGQEPS